MTDQNRERVALEAYLRLLNNQGADDANQARRSALLVNLFPLLAGRPAESGVFREAVDESLSAIERNDWPFYLALSREYFHFWMGDVKAIAAMHAGGGFAVEPPVAAHLEERLKEVWERLDREKFSVVESWPLKAYMAALRDEGADKDVVETRQKLVRLLLVQLRQAEDKNGKVYRVIVESMLPWFAMKETRYLFLAVVREFFYFWVGDPEAAGHIQLEAAS